MHVAMIKKNKKSGKIALKCWYKCKRKDDIKMWASETSPAWCITMFWGIQNIYKCVDSFNGHIQHKI